MQDEPHKKPGWRTALLTFAGVVLLVLFVLGIYTGLSAAVLSDAMKEARALGGPVTIQEILDVRPTWPPGRNGADVILAIKPALDSTTQALKRSEKDLACRLPVVGGLRDPELGQRWSTQTVSEVAPFLERMSPVLATLDALHHYEGGCFPVQLTEFPILTSSDYLETVRAAVKFKTLQMLDRVMQGETSRVHEDVQVALRTASLLEHGLCIQSSLTRTACESLTIHTVAQACSVAVLDADQLLQIQQLFAGSDPYPRLVKMYRNERALGVATADAFRNGKQPDKPDSAEPWSLLMLQGVLMRDQAWMIRCYNRLIAQPDPMAMISEGTVLGEEVAQLGPATPLSRMLLTPSGRAIELHLCGDALMRSAETAMAVERFRLSTGEWPATLDQLVPEYVRAIPEDPFAPGHPLRMALGDQRLIIYSVGPNQQDDGGDLKGREPQDHGFILLHPAVRNQEPSTADEPCTCASQASDEPS